MGSNVHNGHNYKIYLFFHKKSLEFWEVLSGAHILSNTINQQFNNFSRFLKKVHSRRIFNLSLISILILKSFVYTGLDEILCVLGQNINKLITSNVKIHPHILIRDASPFHTNYKWILIIGLRTIQFCQWWFSEVERIVLLDTQYIMNIGFFYF